MLGSRRPKFDVAQASAVVLGSIVLIQVAVGNASMFTDAKSVTFLTKAERYLRRSLVRGLSTSLC